MSIDHIKRIFPPKRPLGRPPNLWVDQIRQELDLPLRTLERIALNGAKDMSKRNVQRSEEDNA